MPRHRTRHRAGHRRHRDDPNAPQHLRVRAVSARLVLLDWGPPATHRRARRRHGRPARHSYRVFRDGRPIGDTRTARFTDATAAPRATYTYTVRVHTGRGLGPPSRHVSVTTPAAVCTLGAAWLGRAPGPGAPPFTVDEGTPLSVEMVDRLLWRAGFGPSDSDRHRWTGRALGELVDWLMSSPQSYPPGPPPLTDSGAAIDPLVTYTELMLEWLDRMQRAANPLYERMTFFWHRHWAVSRADGVPAQFLLAYRDRLYRYADFAANPQASFRTLALEMTTQDAAMLQFLNGFQNVRAHPNENYGREFMELFCLGVTDVFGRANYTQSDVQQLARAFTGWRLDRTAGSPTYGQASFDSSRFDSGVKTILGTTGAFDAKGAIDVVLAHPSHAPHLILKLWSEFIASPIPNATLADLMSTYTAGGALLIAPVIRKILTHPLMFESLCEPNLVKPPIVHAVGVLRALGVPLKGGSLQTAMGQMQQLPYVPPNVAGWEGGPAWLNSGTATARFDLVVRCQNLKYGGYPGTTAVADVPKEKPHQAFDRAWASCGSPWLSDATRTALLAYAAAASARSSSMRRQRFYALQASILGGPDGQVM